MASLIRRVEKQIMKRSRFTREKWIIVRKPNGEPDIVNVKRGGEITDPDDNPIGRHWPARVPARCKMKTRPVVRNPTHHALRRSKNSKKWLAARAASRVSA